MMHSCCSRFRDPALLLLRLTVAAMFFYHGMMKWSFLTEGLPEAMQGTAMGTIMMILAVAEPLAALSLALGLLTPVGAIGLIIVMISAMFIKITGGNDFGAWEMDLLLFSANVVILVFGPGRIALDRFICKKKCGCVGDCECGKKN